MGSTERRERHRQSLRREILDAAGQLFVDQGFEAVTMRKVAERIEYSPTTIYLYFRDKDELFQTICEETFAGLKRRLDRLHAKGLPPVAFLREGLRLYVKFGLEHPAHYTLTFSRGPKGSGDYGYETSVGKQAFEHLREAVAACVRHGDLRTPSMDASAQALWAAVHGLVSLLIAQKHFPFVAPRTLVDHTIDTMIAGLEAR
jgi:AcrR family transcriptional regulator